MAIREVPRALCERPTVHRCRAPREHVLARRLEADGQRSGQNGGFSQRRDLDPRREREPFGKHSPNRIEQEVTVGGDAAAEHDELDIRHCGDRSDVQRDPARDLADDLPSNGIVVSCGPEDRPRVIGWRKLRLATAAR